MLTKTRLHKEMTKQRRNENPKNKSKKWTEAQLLAEIQKRLKGTASENKIAAELAGRSGWKRYEIILRVRRLKETQKWSEAQLRAEIRKRLLAGDSVSKIYARLTELSGWRRREVVAIVKQVQEAEKWTEAQLLAAIREKLKSTRSVNKIATDLEKPSGWKKHEILARLKQLVAAEKWSKAQLHAEINKRLAAGNSAGKISKELAAISGWKTWEISRILKSIREQAKDSEKKNGVNIQEETIVPPDPSTIVHASKRRAEYLKWQDELLSASGSGLRQVRRWGDPIMIAQAGYSVDIVGTTNFQAVKLWSPEGGWGGVTNFLYIPHKHVMKLAGMQIEDQFVAKKPGWSKELNMPVWLGQKMSWLCKEDGTIYMRAGGWRSTSFIRWGTIVLGGNLVTVEEIEVVTLKLPREIDKRAVPMARLKGFRASDWDRPLDELLAEGLVHRCFCAYKSNHFGDSPKGIVYSPFYSPLDWDFAGNIQPKAFYVPVDWLEPKSV